MHKTFEKADDPLQDEADRLREKAAQCRLLAVGIADRQTANALKALADEYDRDACVSAVPPASGGCRRLP